MRRPEPPRRAAAGAGLLALALLGALGAPGARAQDDGRMPEWRPPVPAAPPAPPAIALPPVGQAALPLSLAELVQLSLLHNATAAAARLQAEAATRLLSAEQALYEPIASARLKREGYERPRTYEERTQSLTNINQANAVEQIASSAAGLRGKLPTGASFEFAHELRRRQSNLLASQADRENRGTLTLTLRQPLLRNAGRNATEADLRVAELEQQIERQRFIKQLVDTVGEAAGTYWQLLRAQEQLRLREQAMTSALALQDETRRRVEAGFAPRVDLLEAEVAVGARETERVRAEQLVTEADVRIRNLLAQAGAPGRGLRFRAVQDVPADALGAPAAGDEADVEAPLQRIMAQWPGYQIARMRFEQEDLRHQHARNQQRPDVSLELGYNNYSLAPGLRDGVEDTFRGVHPGWSVGVVFEMPLGNGAARSRAEAQALKRDAARLQMDNEARTVGNEWAARRAQRDAVKRELALLRREQAQREALLQAERSNHAMGRSRLRQLLETEDRLIELRVRQLDVEVRLQLAELSLQALTGELFQRFGVRIDT